MANPFVHKEIQEESDEKINIPPDEKIQPEEKNRFRRTPKKDKLKIKQKTTDWTRAIMYLSIMGMIGIIFIYQIVEKFDPIWSMIMVFLGMGCFFPFGMMLGKLFLDPYVRCKVLRKMRGKNYGLVKFLHAGSQRTTVRIKNLDDDIIVQGTKIWLLDKGGIYYLDMSTITQFKISPPHLLTRDFRYCC